MTEIDEGAANKIVDILHKQYLQMIKMHDLTVQMKESVQRDDNISIQMYLNMRQDVMIAVDVLEGELLNITSSMSHDLQERMAQLLSPAWKDLHIRDVGEEKIVQEYDKIQRQLQKTVALDRELNQKVAGKSSYYQSKF